MARFCRTHIKLRTVPEITAYYQRRKADYDNASHPRLTTARNAKVAMDLCKSELERRGVDLKELLLG